MEIMGDMNLLTDEQRMALRSVIVAFKSYDAEHSQRPASDSEPTRGLTSTELAAIYPSEPNLDIYTNTRNYLLDKALSPRRHSK